MNAGRHSACLWLLVLIFSTGAYGQSRDLTFLAWSDTHFGCYDAKPDRPKIIAEMNSIQKKCFPESMNSVSVGSPVFLIHLGDIVDNWNNGDAATSWKIYLQTISKLNPSIKTYETMGNHDAWHNKIINDRITEKQGRTFYSFDCRNIHFIVLDTFAHKKRPANAAENTGREDIEKLTDDQLAWLEKDLKALPRGTPIILALHYPPRFLNKTDAAKLTALLKGKNVIAYLHGNSHRTEQSVWNGIDVLGTGFSYYRDFCKWGSPTFMVVRIKGNHIYAADYDWSGDHWSKPFLNKDFAAEPTTQPAVAGK